MRDTAHLPESASHDEPPPLYRCELHEWAAALVRDDSSGGRGAVRGVDFDLRTRFGTEIGQLVPEAIFQSVFDVTGEDVRESFELVDEHTEIRLQSTTVAELPAALARAATARAAWGFIYMIALNEQEPDHALGFYARPGEPPLFVDPQNAPTQRVFTDLAKLPRYGRLRKNTVSFLVCSGQPQPIPRSMPAELKRANDGAGAVPKRVCVMQVVKNEGDEEDEGVL